MKSHLFIIIALLATQPALGIEEAAYRVTRQEGAMELRAYEPHLLAEVLVDGTLEEASGRAFGILFGYISGNNTSQQKIAMTAPVSQAKVGEKIAMTAPVSQEKTDGQWRVGFMMPAAYTLETIPKPNDPRVAIRQKPAHRMAATRYRGTWSEKNYQTHRAALEAWIKDQGIDAVGEPVWARYNPPFTPWFMRRNEILVPID